MIRQGVVELADENRRLRRMLEGLATLPPDGGGGAAAVVDVAISRTRGDQAAVIGIVVSASSLDEPRVAAAVVERLGEMFGVKLETPTTRETGVRALDGAGEP